MDLFAKMLSVASYKLVSDDSCDTIPRSSFGPDSLRMPTTTNALDALLYFNNGYEDARWNYVDAVGSLAAGPGGVGVGTGVSLTYSYLETRPKWATADEVDFGVVNAPMQRAIEKVLQHISDIADINFLPAARPQGGQITFATSNQGTQSSAWAYPPWFNRTVEDGIITNVTDAQRAGSVWINNAAGWVNSDWQPGAYGYAVIIHELGHALGLRHPFQEYDLYGNPVWDAVLTSELDTEAHTVMSYTYAPRTLITAGRGADEYLSASTLMMMDIEALQHLYGANMETNARRTIYEFDTNEELLETIWDGGGLDTLDCSNQTLACKINLGDGEFSSIGIRRTDAELKLGLELPADFSLTPYERANLYNGVNNLGIARNAIIENATGGSASDIILGNDVANRLVGGKGNDRLTGGNGNDRLTGGNGLDRLDGGTGRDVFDFNRPNETTLARADVITGFVSGLDRIDLSTLDADVTAGGNQAFSFIGGAAFDAAGQVRFEAGMLLGSTDKDADAEFAIQLAGVGTLAAGDLVL